MDDKSVKNFIKDGDIINYANEKKLCSSNYIEVLKNIADGSNEYDDSYFAREEFQINEENIKNFLSEASENFIKLFITGGVGAIAGYITSKLLPDKLKEEKPKVYLGISFTIGALVGAVWHVIYKKYPMEKDLSLIIMILVIIVLIILILYYNNKYKK